MATLTLTATALPNSVPPAVRLDVTATGTPTVTSVTIVRQNQGGSTSPVRTSDGGPLPVSGGVATAHDFEMPYGTTVTYSVSAAGASTVTKTASVAVEETWLVHVGVPARSMPVVFRVGTNESEDWDIEQGVFPILGRDTPIVVSGGARFAPASSLIVSTETPAEKTAVKGLLSDGSTLLLNVPPSAGSGLETCYIAVGGVQNRRLSTIGADPKRDIVMPYRVVSRPAGGNQALVTWQSVYDDYGSPTWTQLYAAAGSPTWAELANPTT